MDTIVKDRQSNIEWCRLMCMFMVVLGHFIYHGIMTRSEIYSTQEGYLSAMPYLLHALCLCAVNTFVLISGYFSIRPKAKSFLNLYFIMASYACVMYLLHMYVHGVPINRWLVYNTLMPFGLWETSTEWWFMPNYLMLFLLSPIFNKAIDAMSKHEMQISLGALSIVVFYFGWYRNMEWSQGGFNFVQFIFMYFIGRYIALHTAPSHKSYLWLLGWLAVALAIGIINYYHPFNSPIAWYINSYNSPLTVIAAVCLFNGFRSMSMQQNRVINWLASSSLAIYLVHDCAYFRDIVYGSIAQIYDTNIAIVAYVILFAIAAGMVLFIPCIDKIRMLITNPLIGYCVNEYKNIKEKCHR